MNKQTFLLGLITTMTAVLILAGACAPAGVESGTVSASFEFVRPSDAAPASVGPDTPLDVAEYSIEGSGPLDTSFAMTTAEASCTVTDLVPGSWDVLAEARNESGVVLAAASTVVELTADHQPVELFLTPPDGTGTLALSLTWDDTRIVAQSVDVVLTAPDGTETALVPVSGDAGTDISAEVSAEIDAGMYVLTVRIRDGETVVGGCAEAVHVLAGAVSSAAIEIPVEPLSAGVELSVSVSPFGTTAVTLQAPAAPVFVGRTYALRASAAGVDSSVSANSLQWFSNGVAAGGGDTYEITPSSPGVRRIDAVAVDPETGVYGSSGVVVTAIDPVTYAGYVFVESLTDNEGPNDGLAGARGAALSPDGAHLYVAGYGESEIGIFLVDETTGRLSFLGLQAGTSEAPLDGVTDLAVTPDGTVVYAASAGAGCISVFGRDPATGMLGSPASFDPAADAAPGTARVEAVAPSPDGAFLYGTDSARGLVYAWAVDAGTGALTLVAALGSAEIGEGLAAGPEAIAGSPDGEWLAVCDWEADALIVFRRDTDLGTLAVHTVVRDGSDGIETLNGPAGAVFGPDSSTLYVSAYYDDAVNVLSLNGDASAWEHDHAVTNGDLADSGAVVEGLHYARGVAVTETAVFVCGSGDDSLVLLDRDPLTGVVQYAATAANGHDRIDGLDGIRSVVVSADGRSVFTVSSNGNALSHFERW